VDDSLLSVQPDNLIDEANCQLIDTFQQLLAKAIVRVTGVAERWLQMSIRSFTKLKTVDTPKKIQGW